MGKVIAIIFFILYIGFAIYFNIYLYKGLKEYWKSKDWECVALGLMMLLVEIVFVLSTVLLLFTD